MMVADELREAATPAGSDELPPEEKRMVFFRRPDLSGPQLLFQRPRGARVEADSAAARHSTPAQLVTLDGRSKLGFPVHSGSREHSATDAVVRSETETAARRERLPRLLVTSDALDDDASRTRLRRLRINVVVAALANLLATLVLLTPDGQDAWFHVDAFTSAAGSANSERVRSVSPKLLAIASACNVFAVITVYSGYDLLMLLYTLALVLADIWTITLLLPHPFFLLRFMLDMALVSLVGDVRSNLETAWFLTSFHRLRH